MSLEELISETKNVIGGLIKKPKMSDKLLSRPPFRFLHDTVMALNDKCGLVEGLLSEEERDSGSIKDKHAKIAFLEKVIAFAGVCTGEEIDVRATKIVAGAEPENTNMLLQALGKAVIDDSIDYDAAAKKALEGGKPGNVPRKGGKGESKDEEAADPPPSREREQRRQKEEVDEGKQQDEEAKTEAKPKRRSTAPKEEEKSDEQGETGGSVDLSRVDGEPETTIEMFADLIRKPKLNTKLLGKPPFRFLHDIVSNVNSSVGILEGLYEGDELDSRACSSKEQKLAYLDKLIAFVGIASGVPVEARSNRIVAGHEPEKTNKLLQTLALLAKQGTAVSPAEAVQHVLNGTVPSSEVPSSRKKEKKSAPAVETEEVVKKSVGSSNKRAEEAKADDEDKTGKAEQQQQQDDDDESKESERREFEAPSERKPLARPQTARKRPPKIKENATEVREKTNSREGVRAVGVMRDGQDESDESDQELEEDPITGAENRRQNDSNPAFDGEGPKSRLARDILDAEQKSEEKRDEEEDPTRDGADESKNPESSATTPGITMGKIGQSLRRGNNGQSIGSVEVDKIRSAVQLLCQSTNPLGKCMDYVHEDLSVMSKELEKWRNDYRKSCDAMEDEQRVTQETLLPLRGKLMEVDERIKDEQARLMTLKASIAKNDQRIAELLRDMVLN